MPREQHEQLKFRAGELQRRARQARRLCRDVDRRGPTRITRSSAPPLAPQYCLDPGDELAGLERLWQIVVGTRLEPDDPIGHACHAQ